MAGTVMHLVIADKLIPHFRPENPALFYCGNLAPDAIMNRIGYEREMKRHTHLKDGMRLNELHLPDHFARYLERLQLFHQTYVATPSEDHELYLGYVTHLLVDELYILKFRDAYVKKLTDMGLSENDQDFFRKFGKDVDAVDLMLARNYPFSHPMPDILEKESQYEIPGYITNRELMESKAYIIQKNFKGDSSPAPLQVMTLEENLRFIDLCVQTIPGLYTERF